MSATVEVLCEWCSGQFSARVADRKRGWAKFCSKSCKASKQEFGGTKAFWEAANPNNKRSNISKYIDRIDRDGHEHWGHPFAAGYEGHGQN
ncbi:hypothetical protein [Pseudomonas protegens]|uniref:hypothetical protein n=1 Tax=Pseudomonas protegens TaxID=380021 RepID=UPI001B312D02|nr:hypothetical protein [Pseudomonas protegens]MBP5097954.1 hypothetical protein [Pseudomonas protegens]QTU04185.1 hypothetical protein HUT25_10325 [Pseudomonas protegens]QTU10366.1 hypothetical protein HUT23_11015 [Pseudomonas protegens]QTU36188.1 hypothetical protein HUT24_21285 [Pseudomonas protegens]